MAESLTRFLKGKAKRNAPCYCGSGDKYKRCHLRQDREGYYRQKQVGSFGLVFHQPSQEPRSIVSGTPADEVLLRLPERSMVKPPVVIGSETVDGGARHVVLWFYRGLTLEMRFWERDEVACYRVYRLWQEWGDG